MIPQHHADALEDLYSTHGVGDSELHRHAFWVSRNPDTNISHVADDDYETRIAVFETSWLTEQFPNDFSWH